MKTVRVAAGIIQRDNEVLAVQRGYGKMDGLWEFPGGKIDASETPRRPADASYWKNWTYASRACRTSTRSNTIIPTSISP